MKRYKLITQLVLLSTFLPTANANYTFSINDRDVPNIIMARDSMPKFWKDLRGKGYSNAQLGVTVKEFSKTHLMILTALKDSPHDREFGALIRKVVQEQINAGRINIMVMVVDKDEDNIATGMQFVVKGKMANGGVMSHSKSPELRMTVAIETFYDKQGYSKRLVDETGE